MKNKPVVLLTALVLGSAGWGCINRPVVANDPHTQSQVVEVINQGGVNKLDILFVVDNSNSMELEQIELGRRVGAMVEELVHPTERPDGSTPPPLEDIHLAVVSTNMGSGGMPVSTCDDGTGRAGGDNGAFQHTGRDEGCQETYESFISYDGTQQQEDLVQQFACIAHLGTGGCGIEQPLEAAALALTTQAGPGGTNEGFLRDDSLLAVVFVTDEDDCSVDDEALFDITRQDLGSRQELNLRCTRHRDLLYSVDRYVDIFNQLRPDSDRLVVASIVGVPPSWGGSSSELEDMVIEDASYQGGLRPSCDSNFGSASSPVRIVEMTHAMGPSGIVQSICENDWTPALIAITQKIQEFITGRCIARSLPLTADPDICRVVETQIGDDPCPGLSGWHTDLGVDEQGNRLCLVAAADQDANGDPDNGLDGWYYLRSKEDEQCPGEVLFTNAAVPSPGTKTRIECLTSLCPQRRQCEVPLGAACDLAAPDCGPSEKCVAMGDVAVCAPTINAACGTETTFDPDETLVFDGCCHVGFHCEVGADGTPGCVANRTTRCGI